MWDIIISDQLNEYKISLLHIKNWRNKNQTYATND